MEEIRVTTWAELNDALYADSWQKELGRFRSNFAFRGVGDRDAELMTSLMRLGGEFAPLEGHLLRNFRKYARTGDMRGDSVWDWLAVAQHHGLPTRLEDWTYSPYVALHFCTQELDLFDRDGIVWCVNYAHANRLLPARMKAALEEVDADVFTAEMLDRVAHTLAELDSMSDAPFLAFFEPPSLDERIVNQYALFALMSSPTASISAWLAEHVEFVRKVIVPGPLKWEVRDKLDQANITERVLFPGLDGLAEWLTRYYTPRPK